MAGLNGLRIESSLSVEELACSDLSHEIYQLAVILFPADKLNEKFLIKLRECGMKLPESHPVKRWIKWIGRTAPLEKKDNEKREFLSEIINSKFNLITDSKVRRRIIEILYDVPERTLPELVLKSYLYLMIGNVTRSDNILRSFTAKSPRDNWRRIPEPPGLFHLIASSNLEQIFEKMGKHPADRKTFALFILYLRRFYNDSSLQVLISSADVSAISSGLSLKYTEMLSRQLVQFLRLSEMNETKRVTALRKTERHPLAMQSYWIWPFLNVEPMVSETILPELVRLEKEDQLWLICLMSDERMADLFSKAGKIFLPGRRLFLKSLLDSRQDFMLAAYKLIELGDINADLVEKTLAAVTHE